MADAQNVIAANDVTISSSGTTSTALNLQGLGLVGLIMPAAFTGTTITFQMSLDGVTYYDIYNANNTQLSVSVTQGRSYLLVPGDFVGAKYLKVKSGSTEGGTRVITLITRVLA